MVIWVTTGPPGSAGGLSQNGHWGPGGQVEEAFNGCRATAIQTWKKVETSMTPLMTEDPLHRSQKAPWQCGKEVQERERERESECVCVLV